MKTIEKELRITRQMIGIYCRKNHKTKRKILCTDCEELMDYVTIRRTHCPFGDKKTFCAHCPIHCYRKDMRERIRVVMRFSGPRMLLYNPPMALSHAFATFKYKRTINKERKMMVKTDKLKEEARKREEVVS